MPTSPIADQIAHFNTGFTAQIGPDLAGVFETEQTELTTAGVPDRVVAVGDILPNAELLTATGSAVTLSETLDSTPAVIVFYRGAWCPYCNITLRTYQNDLLPALTSRGVKLIAVSPQTPAGSEKTIANGALEFPVLSDPGNRLAAELGIVTAPSREARQAHTQLGFDVADDNADSTADIPFPTVLVVDHTGHVTFVDIHVDYTTRTEVEDILEAVKN